MIDFLFNMLFGVVIGILGTRIFISKENKIVMKSDKWLDVDDHPIPLDYRDFMVTDGNKVDYRYICHYNHMGKPIMSYSEKIVTHWMPLPLPPER